MNGRYQRQIILSDFGEKGQAALKKSKVLVVGAGGLGVPVLVYLNAMGVGTLGIVDADKVSKSNLHRQVLYTDAMVGQPKVVAAKDQLKAQNPETKIDIYQVFLGTDNALEIIEKYDLVVDASDNFPTRYLINDACVVLKKPFVYGALHGFEGQVSVFNYKNGPTYRCLFPTMPNADEVPNCNEHGVLGILPGIIGNFQALEVVKVLTDLRGVLSGVLLLYDALSQQSRQIRFKLNPENLKLTGLAESYDFDCNTKVKSIEPLQIQKLLSKGHIELVDVRTKQEFDKIHLKGAKNIPLNMLEREKDTINMSGTVYLICQSGVRSQKAVLLMQKLFPDKEFINVKGGMNLVGTYANTY
ncbi:HesA/MoeB/ThiF family protein [Maribacter sp. MMG018]|uniref:HesA/MoeB/ThiF family protein n=1 Tax=Maribacter sp. MMG018 TaxID=2822688 RepID=UPI0032B4F56D